MDVDLLVINSSSFCLSWKSFLLVSWQDTFTGYRIVSHQFLYFKLFSDIITTSALYSFRWNVCVHFYLCSSVCNVSFSPALPPLPPPILRFFLSFGFQEFDYGIPWHVFFWYMNPCLRFDCFGFVGLHQFLEFWSLFLQVVFSLHFTYVRLFDVLAKVSEALCIFFTVLLSVLDFGELLFPFLQVY